MELLSIIIFSFIFIGIIIYLCIKDSKKSSDIDYSNLTQDSYMRYAKFYGNYLPTDSEYFEKIHIINDLIINKRVLDIKEIADKSKCSLEECILKIKYLKNKRIIGDYFIDNTNYLLVPCSSEDLVLLEKYKPYIYNSHLQIDEIANVIPKIGYKDIVTIRNDVYNELNYLDDKGLLNGIKIDDIDRKIIYYSLEKKIEHVGFVTKHCPNCGALNDVESDSKVRCGYCGTIILGDKLEGNINE